MKNLLILCATLYTTLFNNNVYAADFVKRSLPACISESYLSAITDGSSLEALMKAGKCTILKVGTPIVIIDRGFMTSKFLYRNIELYAPSEAIR